MNITLVCDWIKDADGGVSPRLHAEKLFVRWSDITGTPVVPNDPNLVVVQAEVTPEQFDKISADANYKIISAEKPQEKPTTKEVGEIRTWLTVKGLPSAEAVSAVKSVSTYEQVSSSLAATLKAKPALKAVAVEGEEARL